MKAVEDSASQNHAKHPLDAMAKAPRHHEVRGSAGERQGPSSRHARLALLFGPARSARTTFRRRAN